MNPLTERALFFGAGIVFGVVIGGLLPSASEGPAPPAAPPAAPPPAAAALPPDHPDLAAVGPDPELLEALTAAVEARPQDPAARAAVGEIHLQAGDFTEAVYWFQQARNLSPEDSDIRARLAFAYLGQGDVGRSAGIYEELLAEEPDPLLALIGLGQIRLFAEQDLEGGIALWERAIAAHPETEEADALRARLASLRDAHP